MCVYMRVYHTRVATLLRIPSVDDQIDSDRQLGDPPWSLGAWDFRHFVPVAVANDNKKKHERATIGFQIKQLMGYESDPFNQR